MSQTGFYKCKVYQISHKEEIVQEAFSRSVFVEIKPTPVIIEKQPQIFLEVKEGDGLHLTCEANSYPSPQFQWYRNNDRLDEHTFSSLTVIIFCIIFILMYTLEKVYLLLIHF